MSCTNTSPIVENRPEFVDNDFGDYKCGYRKQRIAGLCQENLSPRAAQTLFPQGPLTGGFIIKLDRHERYISIVICLAILIVEWLIWSGIYKPLLLGLGAFSCILSVYLAHRLGVFREASGLRIIPRLPFYWFAISIEIVKSSFDVARIILNPKLPISPRMIELVAEPKGPIGQAALGNAITLSPGTVTLDIYDGRLQVHCLTRESAQELLSGNSNRLAAALTSS